MKLKDTVLIGAGLTLAAMLAETIVHAENHTDLARAEIYTLVAIGYIGLIYAAGKRAIQDRLEGRVTCEKDNGRVSPKLYGIRDK